MNRADLALYEAKRAGRDRTAAAAVQTTYALALTAR